MFCSQLASVKCMGGCHNGFDSATLQERLNAKLAAAWAARPALRTALRVAMAAVGSGGPGDLGQRIRDDILAIQSANGAKVSRGYSRV
jgi:hypothetical protein